MYLYQNIKNARIGKKMSQKEIAEVLDMYVQQYSRYETGEREMPIHHLIRLAEFYNLSLDYLVGLTDEEKPLR